MKRVYLAHPLSDTTAEGIEANRRNAARWAAWLTRTFRVAISADWIWMTGVLDDSNSDDRRLGLETDLAHIERVDWFWMVGGRRSNGMSLEFNHAVDCRKPWLDLTHMGYEAPRPDQPCSLLKQYIQEWIATQGLPELPPAKAAEPTPLAKDLDALERLARDATPGRWEAILEDDPRGQPVPYYRALIAVLAEGDQRLSVVAKDVETVPAEQWRANTEFIAAASPETVLRLIAAMRGPK